MLYLVFGALLILGAITMSLYLCFSHAKNRVQAVVLESYCDVKQNNQEFESITVKHMLEIDLKGEKKEVETDLIPVRELSGATLPLYYSKKTGEIYVPDVKKYFTFISAFFLSGAFCLAIHWLKQNSLNGLYGVSEAEWLALISAVIAIVAFSHASLIINPMVLKTKGKFEGILKSSGDIDAEIYSLWYGEHCQYAKRTKGMWLKNKDGKTVTLFYNTKTGQVCRLHEFVISMCISLMAFFAMAVVILVL